MSTITQIIEHLKGSAQVQTLVKGRVCSGLAPVTWKFPRINIHRITTVHDKHMGGASGLADARYQVNCDAETTVERDAVAEAVLDRMNGIINADLGEGLNVRSCFADNDEDDDPPAPTDAKETPIYRRRIDLRIWHTESVPSL